MAEKKSKPAFNPVLDRRGYRKSPSTWSLSRLVDKMQGAFPTTTIGPEAGIRTPSKQVDIFLRGEPVMGRGGISGVRTKTIATKHMDPSGGTADLRPYDYSSMTKKEQDKYDKTLKKEAKAMGFGGMWDWDRHHVQKGASLPRARQKVASHLAGLKESDPELYTAVVHRLRYLNDLGQKTWSPDAVKSEDTGPYMPGEVHQLLKNPEATVSGGRTFEQWWDSNPNVVNWRQKFKEKFGEEPRMEDPHYDYRAAFKAGVVPEESAYDTVPHWSSDFKGDDHPNRLVRDDKGVLDTKTGQYIKPTAGMRINDERLKPQPQLPKTTKQALTNLIEADQRKKQARKLVQSYREGEAAKRMEMEKNEAAIQSARQGLGEGLMQQLDIAPLLKNR